MKAVLAPLALILSIVGSPAVFAQAKAPAQDPVAVAAAARPPAPPASVASRRAAAHADARVCLEFPTELQIVACAEKYRWAKGS